MGQKFDLTKNLDMNKAKEKLHSIESQERDGYIEYELLDQCEWNEEIISPEKVEEIKDSLMRNGLLHNFVVFPKENGRYRILSGNTRHISIGKAIAEGCTKFSKGIRCLITRADLSETEQKIIMEESNFKQRSYTAEGVRKATSRLEKLYTELNMSKGEITQKLVEVTGTGERQVQKYIAINNKLIPELQQLFDDKKISLNKAAAYAQYDEAFQKEIVTLVEEGSKESEKKLSALLGEKKEQEAAIKKEVERLQAEKKNIETEKSSLNNRLIEKENEITRLNETVKNLENQLQKKEEVNDNSEEVNAIKQQLSEAKKQEIEATYKKDKLTKELKRSYEEVAELKKAIEKEKNKKAEIKAADIKERISKKYEIDALGKDILSKLKMYQMELKSYENTYGDLKEIKLIFEQIKKVIGE